MYFELSGRPDGRPAVYLHGGPGGGLGMGGYRRRFDPAKYLIVGFDQRGCGRSTPWAIDRIDTLSTNTTQTLIDDIEALRSHLSIDTWLVHGFSWGSTLALAYALQHRSRVSELVLTAVTAGSREEIDWITVEMRALFPEAWERFASRARPGERVVDAYARILRAEQAPERDAAASAWIDWESTHGSLDPRWSGRLDFGDARAKRNFATVVAHYWASDCFLRDGDTIMNRVGQLAGLPGVLIHGRHDVSGPAITPWSLHAAWPGSELHIVESEGHGGPRMKELTLAATSRFAER
ncbi:alpha/beta fold hydrolase [Microbacterium sp. P05]|uniref:alpha/beta fold hydrolase n=1 Tax=Microbacterium sp. P05 TaxID=3366948 RepID=UPI003746BA6D